MSWGISDGDNVNQAYMRTLIEAALGDGKPAQGGTYVIFYDGDDSEYKARDGLDGKIDYRGTDATTVIQAAIDATTKGEIIDLKPGTYGSTADPISLTIDKPLIMRGTALGHNYDPGTYPMTRLLGNGNDMIDIQVPAVSLENLYLNNQLNTAGKCVKFTGTTSMVNFVNCYFEYGQYGIYAVNTTDPIVVFMSRCKFNYQDIGVHVKSGGTWFVEYSGFRQCKTAGMRLEETNNSYFFAPIYESNEKNGLEILGCVNVIFIHPYFELNATQDATKHDLNITKSATPTNNYDITIINPRLQTSNATTEVYIDYSNTLQMQNWYIPTNCVVEITASNWRGPLILGGRRDGTLTVSNTTTKFLHMDAYVTENSGTSTQNGDGSTTVFNIAHGLASTPTFYTAEPLHADSRAAHLLSADATNIIVTFDAAPPSDTGNVKFAWSGEF